MPYATIFRYALSAALAGLAACGLWLAGRLIAGRRPRRADLPTAAAIWYAAALVQIIGLRLGLVTPRPLGGTLRPVPLATALAAWRTGLGALLYHVVGNMAWFMPLGLLLPGFAPRARWHHALLAGAALSVGLEVMQFLLGTGISDADDVLFNVLGALAGYGAARLIARVRRASRHHLTKTG